MPGGQPHKYKPEYCELLIEHMAEGMTYTSFAGRPDIRVDRATLYNWEKQFPEFFDAKKVGKAMCEHTMIKLGRDALTSKKPFNNTIWIFMMKNMCGWRDKVEEVQSGNISITIDKQDEQL